jgi:hypothetical protein
MIVGLLGLGVLMILVITGGVFLLMRLKTPPQVHQRTLIPELVYCNSHDLKPCIVSFSLDADGNMLVNILTVSASYPDFYLTIGNAAVVNKYNCRSVIGFPTNIYCAGVEMYPGETLQFTLVSIEDDTVLAEGKFAIIGLLLPNPQQEVTATPSVIASPAVTEAPVETPTAFFLEIITPLPTRPLQVTPTSTATMPSYPNPSYP